VVAACNVAPKGRLVVFRGPRTGLSALELFPHAHGHWDACLRINIVPAAPAPVPSRFTIATAEQMQRHVDAFKRLLELEGNRCLHDEEFAGMLPSGG
jgi:hypothetical protein